MYPFEVLANFRDLGGIPTMDGRKVKPRRLLRAGEPYALSEADKQRLVNEYGLRLFIDLRSPVELAERPDDVIEGVDFYHADITLGGRKNITSAANMASVRTVESMTEHMYIGYEEMVAYPEAIEAFSAMMHRLLEMEDGASLFHCFAGKDRTGVTAAVILTALGVDKDEIFKDYLLTNELRAGHNERVYAEWVQAGRLALKRDVFDIAMTVRAEYLEYAYTLADQRYGGFHNFVFKEIGLTPEETARLKELYLE